MTERRRKRDKHELKRYFEETTVHGFRYLVDQSSVGERWIWGLVILSGFAYAGYLIQSSIYEWENNQGALKSGYQLRHIAHQT